MKALCFMAAALPPALDALYFSYFCLKGRGKVIYHKDHKASTPVLKLPQPSGNDAELHGEKSTILES